MEISSIRVFPHNNEDGLLKATASIVFNESLIVRSLRVVASRSNPESLRVIYPDFLSADDARRTCCYPAKDTELGEEISEKILYLYQNSEDGYWTNTAYSGNQEIKPTAVNLYLRSDPSGYSLAKVHVLLDDTFWLRFMQLTKRTDGSLWLSMPKLRLQNDRTIALYHPLTSEFRDKLMEAILPEYEKALRERAFRQMRNLHNPVGVR